METTVEDPDWVREYDADGKGRINLGSEFAGARVKAAIGVLENPNEEDD